METIGHYSKVIQAIRFEFIPQPNGTWKFKCLRDSYASKKNYSGNSSAESGAYKYAIQYWERQNQND